MYMPASRSPTRAPYLSGLFALACYVALLVLAAFFLDGGSIDVLLQEHAVFFLGLPFAGLAAHFLVGTLENRRGPIDFEALGMRFRGSSGTIVLWVVVFLAIVVAIRLMWTLA